MKGLVEIIVNIFRKIHFMVRVDSLDVQYQNEKPHLTTADLIDLPS
jgi:hypothetical protein